jgi:AraC-like DNA-binding protein/quercetin dioxygenase-like cupin family protein
MSKLVPSPLNPEWLIPEGWEHILGARLDYRLGNSALHLWRVQFNQHAGLGAHAGPHAHTRHQLLYYQRGSGELRADTETYRVTKGSIFVVPSRCRHQFTSDHAEPAVCLAMDFTIDESAYATLDLGGLPMQSEVAILLSLLHARQARPFQVQPADQEQVDRCIVEIVAENERREAGYATLIQANLLRLIALCLRATQRAQGFGAHFRHTAWRHALVVERATALIRANATRQPELTLPEAARACATSANHLNRILREHTGRTFHQALLRCRLESARALLEDGRVNCTEAALQSGFNDSNYFARAFRKFYGRTPSSLARATRSPPARGTN